MDWTRSVGLVTLTVYKRQSVDCQGIAGRGIGRPPVARRMAAVLVFSDPMPALCDGAVGRPSRIRNRRGLLRCGDAARLFVAKKRDACGATNSNNHRTDHQCALHAFGGNHLRHPGRGD